MASRGANYGWPCYEGAGTQSAYQSTPLAAPLSAERRHSPVHTYNH